MTTPVYFGVAAQVKQAMKCDHQGWTELVREVREGNLLITERCKTCIGTRMKYRKATAAELQEKKP